MPKITESNFRRKAYVCICVFKHDKPVLLVSREGGNWCFLCGDAHPDSADHYSVVALGAVIDFHPDLAAVLDLVPEEEAERIAMGEPWIRTMLSNPQ